MSYKNEKILKKIALMNAKKTLNQFSYIELIDFEDYDSQWLEVFEFPLKHFRKIDSEPTYSMTIGDSNGYISWFESSLEFLKEKKEWFILVPNCPFSVWANVRVLNITKAIEELWETSVKIKNEGRRIPLGFNLQKYVDNAPSKWNDKY